MTTYPVTIGALTRRLPIVAVAPDVSIAFLKLYGDPPLVSAAVDLLAQQVSDEVDIILGPEAGGILLAHLLAERLALPYVVARKKARPNMVNPLSVPVRTIGTSQAQALFLGEDDCGSLHGKNVAVIDEVVSSGGTLDAVRSLVHAAGGRVVQALAVATEGEPRPDVTSLLHLPLFTTATTTP
ncbi:phosphoribosyltransferase family protein [Streptomyces diastatochromogenes]|uniref:phosphoribosyltransferase family protein n=1 Tax=Streptomyces diastatochromogenes TaxID=42236 RepID=UPI003656880D